MQPKKHPLQPAVPHPAPRPPHSGEGSHSALEALKRVLRDKPASLEPRWRTR
jgi:hypothetical protein